RPGRCWAGYIPDAASAPKVVFLQILMVLSTVSGMLLVDPTLIKVGRSFNAGPAQMVTKIYLPSLVLPIITGLRLGLGVAIIGTLIAEIKLSNAGLGFLAIQYYDMFRVPDMYAVIIVIFALAMGANGLMTRLNDRLGRRGMPSPSEVSGAA
ncbi:MAG TPA: ABC transporter permease subunit, partial [Alphaproteobacteria bacterium]